MKVLITGTGKGIGKAIAQKFLEFGHAVYGIDKLTASITHKNYTHFICDITKKDGLPELSGVEILINNAGVQNEGNDIEVNLSGTMSVTEKYAFQEKIKSVLMIASAAASTGAEFTEYAASKGGVVSYSKNVALRLAEYGATCNSFSPGGFLTDSNAHIINSPELWDKVMGETLLKKWMSVSECADWAYFLTVVNKSMTGQDVISDNGEISKATFIW
jgi:NAD(P)-dependent dehydrogenase (short-subunit alcohol dehydrogenase family)